jgi:hypothetical protein
MQARAQWAARAHAYEHAVHALENFRDMFVRLANDPAAVLDLADAIEDPRPDRPIPKQYREALSVIKDLYDQAKAEVEKAGLTVQWRDNYLARGGFWGDESVEKTFFKRHILRRRPIEGSKSFTKKRAFPTLRDRVEATKQRPPTWNLIDLQIEKIREMYDLVAGHRLATWAKTRPLEAGGALFVPVGRKAPKDLVQIDDPAFVVYAPPAITVKEAFDQKLMEGAEQWADTLGVQYSRHARTSKWGVTYTTEEGTVGIKMKVGSPESALVHEIGHALDRLYGLGDILRNVDNADAELSTLADMRFEGVETTDEYKAYVQEPNEHIANAVAAFVWAPEQMRKVAPNVYAELQRLSDEGEPQYEPLNRLRDTRSMVFGEREATLRLGGPILMGRYYALPEVARVINNHTMKGLGGRSAIYDSYRWLNNAMIRMVLSFSGFHAVAISQEAGVNAFGTALSEGVAGRFKRAIRPLAMAALFPAEAYRQAWKGTLAQRRYVGVGPGDAMLDSEIQRIILGGQRIHMERDYSTQSWQQLKDALKGEGMQRVFGGLYHLVPGVLEMVSVPVMEWFVPKVKLGVFLTRVERRLAALPGDPTLETLRQICTEESDYVDNAFGEMVKDNLHWNRILTDVLQSAMLSPTWNIGSFRGFAGGIASLPRAAGYKRKMLGYIDEKGKRQEVPEGRISSSLGWLIGVLVFAAYISSLYQLAHGQGPTKDLKDVFHPRNGAKNPDGSPERRTMPGMGKDIYAALHRLPWSLGVVASHKVGPLANMLQDTIANEDDLGTEVHDWNDPVRKQLVDYFLHYAPGKINPITFQSIARDRREGRSYEEMGESLLGISRASADVDRTAAEQMLRDLRGPVHRTIAQKEALDLEREIRQGRQAGTPAGTARAQAARDSGQLSRRQMALAEKQARTTFLESSVSRLPLDQALKVYEAGTEDERAQINAILVRKRSLIGAAPREKQEWLRARYDAVMALPMTPRAPMGGP